MFNGHIDTNPVTEGWTVDPWGGKVDDKFIYGIGVSNMKSGDAAYFCAVKTLIDAGVKLKGDVHPDLRGRRAAGRRRHRGAWSSRASAPTISSTASRPTCRRSPCMRRPSSSPIELVGDTRHLSKREEAVDAIVAACDLVPRLNALKFSGRQVARAREDQSRPCRRHARRARQGAARMAAAAGRRLRQDQGLRPLCAGADAKRAPWPTCARELDALERRHPGLKATVSIETARRVA